jgi:hypothetical protein
LHCSSGTLARASQARNVDLHIYLGMEVHDDDPHSLCAFLVALLFLYITQINGREENVKEKTRFCEFCGVA